MNIEINEQYLDINSLTEKQKTAYIKYKSGEKVTHIAKDFGVSPSTIRVRLQAIQSKARAKRRQEEFARRERLDHAKLKRNVQNILDVLRLNADDALKKGYIYPGSCVEGYGVVGEDECETISNSSSLSKHFNFKYLTRYGVSLSVRFQVFNRKSFTDLQDMASRGGVSLVGWKAGVDEMRRLYRVGV